VSSSCSSRAPPPGAGSQTPFLKVESLGLLPLVTVVGNAQVRPYSAGIPDTDRGDPATAFLKRSGSRRWGPPAPPPAPAPDRDTYPAASAGFPSEAPQRMAILAAAASTERGEVGADGRGVGAGFCFRPGEGLMAQLRGFASRGSPRPGALWPSE
jgi:hypothetical protein